MPPQEVAQEAAAVAVNCCAAFSCTVGLIGEMLNPDVETIVSTALVVYAVPVAAVATILQLLPAAADAVNNPLALMLPQDAVQFTDRFAVNCCVSPCAVEALDGVIANGEVIATPVDAVFPLPSDAMAVTVHAPGAKGAANRPALEMVPQFAFHVAAWLAVNCCVAASFTLGFNGAMENPLAARIVSYP